MKKLVVLAFGFFALVGCGNSVAFKELPDTTSGELGELFFPMETTKDYQKISKYDVNETTMVFQVFDATNKSVKGLKAPDFKITENGVGLVDYLIIDKNQNGGRRADIVFVLDITASMDPSIQKVKNEVTKFVEDLKKQNIQANLCLVTFKDDVDDVCSMFIEDDPSTAKNENLDSFVKKVKDLQSGGGGDTPENQLLGLEVAASVTPWHPGAQRMAVLITDEKFHYAPDNRGNAGDKAPTYDHTLQTVIDNHMQVFAVAPSRDGYKNDFKGLPSLPKASEGMWFDFNSISGNGGSLSRIFDAIVDQVSTTYTLQFTSEKNPGLNPTLSLAQRNILISDANTTRNHRVKSMAADSTQPNGRPAYPTRFKLRGKALSNTTTVVKVNGQVVSSGIEVVGDELRFNQPPPSEAEMTIEYFLIDLKDNIKVRQVRIPQPKNTKYALGLVINGIIPKDEDFEYKELDSSSSLVMLKDHLFDNSDPFKIFVNRGLRIKVRVDKIKAACK